MYLKIRGAWSCCCYCCLALSGKAECFCSSYYQNVLSVLALPLLINQISMCSLSDFDSLSEEDVAENNQLAFDVAEREFGIQPMIRGEEMAAQAEPDQLLMVLYLSKFYEAFRISPGNSNGQVPSCSSCVGLFP